MYTHPIANASEHAKELRTKGGAWLKGLRKDKKLTQRELAMRVGFDYYTMISQVESGKARVPPDKYEVFADAFGMDHKEFIVKLLKFYDPFAYKMLVKTR
jgi:transcriptional regulator with XRE-family HTH domain